MTEELLPINTENVKRYGAPSVKAAYARIARRQWPFIRIGRRVYLRPEEMTRFLSAHAVEPLEDGPDPRGGKRGAA